jgi:hypothetical protein
MTWPIELLPALWLWQECAGTTGYPWWGREHIVAVEPHTSWPSRPLDVEIAEGAASWIEPGEGISATFSLRAERCAPGELDDFVSRTRADALSTRDGVNQEEE